MKTAILFATAILFSACSESKPAAQQQPRIESVADIPVPENVPPPVEALAYDDGYKTGYAAGETSAKALMTPKPRTKPARPSDDELAVYALDAAGTDEKRGQKWQRGFAAGFKDAFVSIVEGKL
jgi:hypothetical protein